MRRAQALLEVAIFGAIIVMLLGVLISYGIRYNSQQKLMQQSFRKSLAGAVSEPGKAISNVLLGDTHIPNPADTFGIGSVTPFTGSAGSIIRDYRLNETPDQDSELPRIKMSINGKEFTYRVAGFRDEYNVPESSLDRYDQIYGSGNVWSIGEGECLEEEETTDPNTGQPVTTCNQPSKNIRIIDSCAGEVFDYGTAVKQCRMIVDSAACVKECSRANDSTDCNSVCSHSMNIPWYCANYTETDTVNHAYNFPVLNQLFSATSLKALGLQQNYQQRITADSSLRRTEDTSGIATTDNVNWETEITRKIITQPYGSTSGATTTEEVTSAVSQNKVESRKTGW
ncbi:MAG: hypothetical protein PHO03_00235 [Candidatus Omnitrophica bacterium]|nr:hypothetical protein [Candidatus Omnitrophota bacterium]